MPFSTGSYVADLLPPLYLVANNSSLPFGLTNDLRSLSQWRAANLALLHRWWSYSSSDCDDELLLLYSVAGRWERVPVHCRRKKFRTYYIQKHMKTNPPLCSTDHHHDSKQTAKARTIHVAKTAQCAARVELWWWLVALIKCYVIHSNLCI